MATTNGKGATKGAVTGASIVAPSPPPATVKPPDSLTDHITLVLMDLAGGPVKLALIRKFLRERGVEVTDSAVINCMQRKPDRFRRMGRGMYELLIG